MASYQLLDKLRFQHGLKLDRYSICPKMDLLVLFNKQSTKLYRVNGSLIWERDLAIDQLRWNFDGKFIVVLDRSKNIHLLDVKDGSTFYQFAGGDISSVDAFKVESPTRNISRFTFLPTLNALPDVSKSINQFLPFRLPKMEKKDGDYVKTLIDKGFPYIPIDSTSVAMNVREETLVDSSESIVVCRYNEHIQIYLQCTLKLPLIPLPKMLQYDNMVITPQLDIYTLTHYGKIAIPRDIHHLGALSSQVSMVLSYALEGVTRLTKLYADNGGPRSESLKWSDKIGEFMKPHCEWILYVHCVDSVRICRH